MKKNVYLLLLLLVMVLSSCATKDTVRYTIASQQGDCTGVVSQKCMLVKKGDAKEWTYFYSKIEGFDYQQGYEYVLDVKEQNVENPPADASSVKYTLVKEVSKIEKTSENLPIKETPAIVEGFQCTGKVLSVEKADIGRGAAAGKVSAIVVKLLVTTSTNDAIKVGETIHSELIPDVKVQLVEGREYVFKAKHLHPAHAKGIYLLETEILDLTR